ncbi:hypothetical protein C8R46DRAFT_1103279 [Mycena filopes]|nr:hypothetical protein C8R46DRAFT_1103279 [Mycena filopes]
MATTVSAPAQDVSRLPISPTTSILDNDPSEVLDLALSRLQAVGVEVIEWRDLVYRRMKVPASITNYSYLVADTLVAQASQVLTDLGLPFSPPTKFEVTVYGDFAVRGHSRRITRSIAPGRVQHVVIYPQSFAAFADSELEKGRPNHIALSRCSTVFVPTAPAVYASILRMMLQYNSANPLRTHWAHLLGLSGGYIDADDDEVWERWDVDRRISDAVHLVRSWGVDQVWRDGEEWMGDALAEVVKTGHIASLPHKPPP